MELRVLASSAIPKTVFPFAESPGHTSSMTPRENCVVGNRYYVLYDKNLIF